MNEELSDDYQNHYLGLMNDYGGGNVGWWHDYLRSAVDVANESGHEQYLSLLELAQAKEKELATAKAENARKSELLKWFCEFTAGFEDGDGVPVEELDEWIAANALSISDALDYWQGEIRKARDKAKLGIASYLEQFENSVNCDEMAQLIRDDVARQSNPQSKGEKGEGE